MINASELIKVVFAQSLLALLIVSPTVIASESPVTAPCCQPSEATQSRWIELPKEALQKLKIDAGFGWGIFSGTIYNGNENYHVTQLIVSMIPIHGHHPMEMHATMSHEPKVHPINLDLPPVSKGALSMPLAGEDVHVHDFKWEVIKVMGYPTR